MNLISLVIGYSFMVIGGFYGLLISLLWIIGKTPLNRKVLYILRLGEQAYLKIPRNERKA